MALLAVLGVALTACVGSGAGAEPTSPAEGDATTSEAPIDPIEVGAGPDPESVMLAHTLAALLGHEGLPAEVVPFADAQDVRQALELGAIDLAPSYTGEAWLETLGRADPPGDPRQSFAVVRDHDEPAGLVWLRPRFGDGPDRPPANATFAFVVQGPPGIDADLRTMSQLAARLSEQPEARVCVDREFATRPDGLSAVLAAYSVRSDRPFLAAGPEEAVAGVAAGDCIAGLTTATDGAVWRGGLRPLLDDLQVFPAFVPLPLIRADVLDEHPSIRVAAGPLAAHLTTPLLGTLNARLLAGEPVEAVADDAARELRVRAGLPVEDLADEG